MAVNCQADETVCFSWILWPSRDVHNEAMPEIMADPRLGSATCPMPFNVVLSQHFLFHPHVIRHQTECGFVQFRGSPRPRVAPVVWTALANRSRSAKP